MQPKWKLRGPQPGPLYFAALALFVSITLASCELIDDITDPPNPDGLSLAIATQPGSAVSGRPLGVQPVIEVRDENGAVVADDNSTVVTAAIESGSGSLGGTASVTVVAGVASFSDLSISGEEGDRTLSFSAPSFEPVTSSPFMLQFASGSGASPTQSILAVSSPVVVVGSSVTLSLETKDADGIPLATGGLAVVFTATGGSSQGVIGETVDNGDGTYEASFAATTVGTPTTIGATIDGMAVTSVPPTVRVASTSATSSIVGIVESTFGARVGGGLVEVLNGDGTLIATATPDGNGDYLVDFLEAGTYDVRLHANAAYSLAEGEPDPKMATVSAEGTAFVDFFVQEAVWYDDFRSYTDDADFHARFAEDAGGRRMAATGLAASCVDDRIHLDPSGGPNGVPSMRYDYWDRNADPTGDNSGSPGCGQSTPEDSYSLYYGRLWDTAITGSALWLKVVVKDGTTPEEDPVGPNWFSIGCVDCAEPGGIYKYMLGGDTWVSLQMTASGSDSDPLTGHKLNWKGVFEDFSVEMGDAPDWQGRWHTYVWGWDNGTLEVWVDGEQVFEGSVSGSPSIDHWKFGANMNSGPSQEQSRWFAHLGVYRGRPSATLSGQ